MLPFIKSRNRADGVTNNKKQKDPITDECFNTKLVDRRRQEGIATEGKAEHGRGSRTWTDRKCIADDLLILAGLLPSYGDQARALFNQVP